MSTYTLMIRFVLMNTCSLLKFRRNIFEESEASEALAFHSGKYPTNVLKAASRKSLVVSTTVTVRPVDGSGEQGKKKQTGPN